MTIDVDGENMTLSWMPPYTIDGVPILQYTVYIISQRHTVTETLNSTETHITLMWPCIHISYGISAWNDVGEGQTTIYGMVNYVVLSKMA